MRRIGSIITAAATAVLLASAVQAGPAQAAAKACDLGFMPTKPTVGVGSIIGNAWVKCDVAPERHELRLGLQIRTGGSWKTDQLISDATIPYPRATYGVKASCTPGLWRVQAQAVGSLSGHPFDFVDYSMERFVTADDCARGN
ncbi:hypothetical protein [Nocardia cerradoensis]|uniref:Secreted protein n=1 Tax=Nocardia cerradoensis TaxID=85688 RepID=A0A231GTU2_9NOCA|nr:hypothetical protein [Nocardia cerradoensis]NKY48015.1 hypothetical protein [Nocardia cerradoensis]OXR39901.1 hypothetical protein B7C42_08006 [Nocardia cerradoensis]